MMSPVYHFHPPRMLAACGLSVLAACANPALDRQIATSQEALEQAKTAGAQETASADFQTASDKLNRSKVAARERDHDIAMRLAEQAEADANLAHAKTGAAHATIAANELAQSNQILRELIRRTQQKQ